MSFRQVQSSLETYIIHLRINFMEGITSDQERQLKTWAQRRDEILAEITKAQTEYEPLARQNKVLSDSNTELEERVQKHKAILSMADQVEKERMTLVSKELVELEQKKTILEVRIPYLEKDIAEKEAKKQALIEDINNLQETHDRVFNRVSVLDKIVEYVVRVSQSNETFINKLISHSKNIVDEREARSQAKVDENK